MLTAPPHRPTHILSRLTPLVLLLAWGAVAAQAEITVGRWQPLYQGVEYAEGAADAKEPRLQRVHAVRIDLRASGIEFLATPANGELPLETTSETTTAFLTRHRLQVAINANFFDPCCDPGEKNLLGLAISQGQLVSPPVRSGIGAAALLITRDNHATITADATALPLDEFWTAVSGSELVLVKGRKLAFPSKPFHTTSHPRTAVGLTRDGRYLLLVIIDGRQPDYSVGAPMDDVAEWLLRFGAYDGLNLDGGGSTALVCERDGAPVNLNRPSGAAKPNPDGSAPKVTTRIQRSNGNNFGLRARPLARQN